MPNTLPSFLVSLDRSNCSFQHFPTTTKAFLLAKSSNPTPLRCEVPPQLPVWLTCLVRSKIGWRSSFVGGVKPEWGKTDKAWIIHGNHPAITYSESWQLCRNHLLQAFLDILHTHTHIYIYTYIHINCKTDTHTQTYKQTASQPDRQTLQMYVYIYIYTDR